MRSPTTIDSSANTERAATPSLSSGMPSVLDLELARLRALTASEKVAVMQSLWRQAWSLKTAGVQAHHPDWSREQVEAEVREIFCRNP